MRRDRPVPVLFLRDPKASTRFWEFFTATIRNKNTRRAYYAAACRFSEWLQGKRIADIGLVKPIHVAAYIEQLTETHSKPTVKQHLAALRMLFDWLVTGHIIDVNPAHAVRGPKFSVRKGKTPVLNADEARTLLDSINNSTCGGIARSRINRPHGLYVRASWSGHHDEGGRLLHPRAPGMGAAA